MVGKIQLYLQDMTTALKSLEMSRKILAVTHGTEHKIYKDVTLFVEQCREELRVQLEKSVS
ncbi:hypothetical protein DPMN_067237 [Dreissena polymorpha]|uniref:Uncharacterized protein n=2 Tax=Dreissena polymorpha TaxID=45954 RepID=A0A9D4BL69_DREPO|nr:hypothetical protein DPMN_067221 [Dreissena polymorpha]KAH3707821.1 hypothetical protein DPMN_067237 [Dreissena polymorpha]